MLLEHHSIEFYVGGQKIRGNLHLPYTGAPCIIVLHGLDSHKDSTKWLNVALRLFKEGYACLRFNFRGCGEADEKSDGLFEDTNLTSRIEDYRAALKFLRDCGKVDVQRIGVIGSSFGGMVAIAAQERGIKALVTISTPYTIQSLGETKLECGEETYYLLPSGRRLKEGFYRDLRKYDLLKAVRSAPPILIIHGSSDQLVPVDHAFRLFETAREPKRIEIIDGADHAFTNPEHLNKAISLAIEWFKKHF
ncbi:MAG: alpha/beta fold hydrolase [Candidatus Bathyarchaeia archaeon]